MKKTIKQLFDFLLYSNIFMALCAVAQGLVTFYLIGSKPVYTATAILFTATLGIYNFCILVAKPANPEQSPLVYVRCFYANYRLMVTITIVCILSLVPLFFLISFESRILLVFLAILSFCYGIPLFSFEGQKFGL